MITANALPWFPASPEDASIVSSYLKENGFEAHAWRGEVYVRVRYGELLEPSIDVQIWPNRVVNFMAATSCHWPPRNFNLPRIESPRYVEELRDVLAEVEKMLHKWWRESQ